MAEDESPRHRVEPKKRASDMSNAALEALRPLLRRAEGEGWDASRLQATVVAVMDDYVETKQKLSALLNL